MCWMVFFTLIYSFAAVKKQDASNEEKISERKKSAKRNVNNEKSLFENEEDNIEQKEVSGNKTSGEFEYALNQELKYASENETDLTLFLVNVINIDWQSEAAEKILTVKENVFIKKAIPAYFLDVLQSNNPNYLKRYEISKYCPHIL